jgi:hypothetical protein
MFNIFKKSKEEDDCKRMAEYQREGEERQKEIDARIEKFKVDNPIKYKSGDTIFHWVVYNGYFTYNSWHGYGTHNKDNPRNEYGVVNFTTGETRTVEEYFLDNLVQAKKNMKNECD